MEDAEALEDRAAALPQAGRLDQERGGGGGRRGSAARPASSAAGGAAPSMNLPPFRDRGGSEVPEDVIGKYFPDAEEDAEAAAAAPAGADSEWTTAGAGRARGRGGDRGRGGAAAGRGRGSGRGGAAAGDGGGEACAPDSWRRWHQIAMDRLEREVARQRSLGLLPDV
eukprot:TRINITY_DN35118_c0_g1_i1.p2 TRINITY_DN35118_c0_g1~~TRINITY_DN35118_c0_g1_i1.p2  ORF type:complete len:192 (+),score=31.29 TRINITY_DN35118_c0_g1_i1:73-576(+)